MVAKAINLDLPVFCILKSLVPQRCYDSKLIYCFQLMSFLALKWTFPSSGYWFSFKIHLTIFTYYFFNLTFSYIQQSLEVVFSLSLIFKGIIYPANTNSELVFDDFVDIPAFIGRSETYSWLKLWFHLFVLF